MKRQTFYIVTIILVCIGAISGVALTQVRSKSLLEVCSGDECETTIKEYQPLEETDENVVLLEGGDELISDNPETETPELIEPKESKVIDNPSFITDEKPETEEGAYYKHNGFIAGETVTLKQAGFDGILFAAGNKIKSHGVQDYLVTAGSEISIDSTTTRDLFAAGQIIDFSKNANIRDGYIAAAKVIIRGNVDGNLNIAAGEVIFDNANIKHDINLAATTIEFKGDSKIYGTLNYNDDAQTTNLDKNKIAGIKNYKSVSINTETSASAVALKMLRSFCVTAVSMAFLSLIIARFSPKSYESLQKNADGFKDMCVGLVTMLVLPAILLLLLFIEYFSIIGFLGVIAMIAFFIIGAGVAVIRLGKFVDKNLIKSANVNEYSICLFGALSFAVLSAIPVLGGVVIFFAIIAGFGFMISKSIAAFKQGTQNITKIVKK
jgi:cytoskeletal protein CcmA (bactofilin family)